MNSKRLRKIIARPRYYRKRYRQFNSLGDWWRYLSYKGVLDADKMMQHFYLKAAWYIKRMQYD